MDSNVRVLTRQQYAIQELVSSDPKNFDGWALCNAYNSALLEISRVIPEDLQEEFGRLFKPIEPAPAARGSDIYTETVNGEKNRKVASSHLIQLLGWIKGEIAIEKAQRDAAE